MTLLRVTNKTRNSVLGGRITIADRWWSRFRGFLGRAEPQEGEGLLLMPAKSIHMYGMRFPLDVLFLDRTGRVVGRHVDLRPGERTDWYADAEYALELPVGTIESADTKVGDQISWSQAEEIPHRIRSHAGITDVRRESQ